MTPADNCAALRLANQMHALHCKPCARPAGCCNSCSAVPAPLEVAAPGLDCVAYFCSAACIQAFNLEAMVVRWEGLRGEFDDDAQPERGLGKTGEGEQRKCGKLHDCGCGEPHHVDCGIPSCETCYPPEDPCKCCGAVACDCVIETREGYDPQSGPWEAKGCVEHGPGRRV